MNYHLLLISYLLDPKESRKIQMASRRMNEKPEIMAPRRDAMCLKFVHERIGKDGHKNPTETKAWNSLSS